ncbi:MAG TPA: hypothetical protein VN554_03350, partial [Verrucomicrobiae bacterium]|nr:hypothetical protein [Verrucomicrobiae bacterium]
MWAYLYRSRLIAISLLTMGGILLSAVPAAAAPQVLTLTPTSLDRVIQPGTTYNGSFEVLNQGQGGYTFHVYAAPYSVKNEDYTPDFTTPLPGAPNVASWFKFSTANLHVEPGQSSTVNYSITMPANTPPGGYYAAAFAETKLPPKANSIVLNERVGEIFYLQAAGPVTQKAALLSWQSGFFQKPPLTSTLRLKNAGSVHYRAAIDVQVQDIFGHNKYKLQTVKEVLPQTIRKVSVSWQKTPSIGLFKVKGSVSLPNQKKTLPTRWVLVMSQPI